MVYFCERSEEDSKDSRLSRSEFMLPLSDDEDDCDVSQLLLELSPGRDIDMCSGAVGRDIEVDPTGPLGETKPVTADAAMDRATSPRVEFLLTMIIFYVLQQWLKMC